MPSRVPVRVPGPARGAARGGPEVRLTLHPGEDVLVRAGRTLGELRVPLAELLRRPELRHGPLVVDGVPVDDGAAVGRRPLLSGATLGAGAPGRDVPALADAAAVRSPWLVARATGPRAGELLALRSRVLLDGGSRDATRIDSRRGRVRVRTRGARVHLVRTTPSGRERRRRVGLVPRPWRTDARLDVAGVGYALHPSGDVARWLAPEVADASRTAPGLAGTTSLLAAFLPVVGSVGLAVALRQPVYALFSLLGVLALVPQLAAAARRRTADGRSAPSGPPAATSHDLGPPRPGADPARVYAQAIAAHEASDGAWTRALGARTPPAPDPAEPLTGAVRLLPDRALAVCGERSAVRAVARAVVVDLAAQGAAVEVTGAGRSAWAWCRWLPEGGEPVLVVDVAETGSGRRDDLAAADAAAARGVMVVLCLSASTPVPGWCRATVTLAADGRAVHTAPDGTGGSEPMVGVSPEWAERAARRLAGLDSLGRGLAHLRTPLAAAGGVQGAVPGVVPGGVPDVDPGDPRLPACVPLADLLPVVTDEEALAHHWQGRRGWAVPLGIGTDGAPVVLDLVADGPHVLVAGTTGSGKSELLRSFVLGLAARRSPQDLAFVLVDFKGGASLGACAALPHVVGQVTDLEPGLAARALAGLRAELHRRERVLAEHRVTNVADLPPGSLPRLVVVIDEFRALADDLPEFVPGLLRVAAQGRSLGVHLVLATQRPAGAVSADVRANVSARIALRVVDPADSLDVVETTAAARIDVGTPGRAVLRVGAGRPVTVQTAHAGSAPDDGPRVRRAPAWGTPEPSVPTGLTPGSTTRDAATADVASVDVVTRVVEAARRAATAHGLRPGAPPWLPSLPEKVTTTGLDGLRAPRGRLPVALADEPALQRRSVVGWDPAGGHLAIVGRARSGRTTTLVALARAALGDGWHVHALVGPASAPAFEPLVDHPGFGTLAGPHDPRRSARLLRLLAEPGPADGVRTVVVVDGVEELRAALAGTDRWDPLVLALSGGRAAFALTADGATVGGVAHRVGPRLVLLGTDKHADVVLGAPSALAGTGGPAGRAAWLDAERQVLCQVLLPGDGPPTPRTGPSGTPAAPLRIRTLPALVRLPEPAGSDPRSVVVGLGGDDAGPVAIDLRAGALVVGPRGSGRTTALRVVARRLATAGALVGIVARDPALLGEASGALTARPAAEELRALLRVLEPGPATGVLVVDDLDAVAHTCPVEAERLAVLVGGGLVGGGLAVVGAATTTGALMSHRGLLGELRGRRTGILLGPAERGSEEVFGTSLADVVEPGPPRPGRGALVGPRGVVAVQVELPADPVGVRSALRGGDDGPGHEQHQHHQRDDDQRDTGQEGPRGAGRQQADAHEPLEQLPHRDRGPAAASTAAERPGARDEHRRDAEEEHDQECADSERAGAAADQLEQDGARGQDEEDGFDHDADEDHLEASGPTVATGRIATRSAGGGDRSGHGTPGYVGPGVSRQCDQSLTLHGRQTCT